MRTVLLLCLVLACVNGFSEESVAPHAGTFGFIGIIQTPSDSDTWVPGNELSVSPGVGAGFHYHPFDFLMLEMRVFPSYDIVEVAGTTAEYFQITSEAGIYYWRNLDSSFSIFAGPRIAFFQVLGSDSNISRSLAVGLFGAQYSFSRHFAAFSDFGFGFFRITASGVQTRNYTYLKVISPEVGVTFYF
jgi:hypothetical protein